MDCRLYTRARRHEIMVGKVGDIPVPAARWWQPASLLIAIILLFLVRDWWWQLPVPPRVLLFLGVIVGSWWGSGQFTANPYSSLVGLATYVTDRFSPFPREGRQPARLVVRVPVVTDQENP